MPTIFNELNPVYATEKHMCLCMRFDIIHSVDKQRTSSDVLHIKHNFSDEMEQYTNVKCKDDNNNH